jgi:hypothetical protein
VASFEQSFDHAPVFHGGLKLLAAIFGDVFQGADFGIFVYGAPREVTFKEEVLTDAHRVFEGFRGPFGSVNNPLLVRQDFCSFRFGPANISLGFGEDARFQVFLSFAYTQEGRVSA